MSLILSEHFRLAEFTTSLVAVTRRIDNTPPLPACLLYTSYFGSSGCSFLFLAARLRARHSSSASK